MQDAHGRGRLEVSYFNYEHGGMSGIGYSGGSGPYDYTGLVRVAGDGGRWPDVLVMGEGDRYDDDGGKGAWGAASALREASSRPYIPLLGSLPREWGPFAPVIFFDANAVVVEQWHDHRNPYFAARNRNLLVARRAGTNKLFHIVAFHGDINSGTMRLEDVKPLHRFAKPPIPCVVLGDFNEPLSGPQWEASDLNNRDIHPEDELWRLVWRLLWQHGPQQAGPHRTDTQAMDYLVGYWHQDHRVGGVGFFDVAELAGDPTPTTLPRANGRQPTAIDHILVNQLFRNAVLPGSYQVHQPADPANPDSDHLRVSVTLQW